MSVPTARPPMFEMPSEEHLGPSMLALTLPQRAFVIAILETGTQDNSLAARMAGFGNNDHSAWQAGWRLSNNPKVQAAIKEEADRRLRAGALVAASVLVKIAGNDMHKDQFKAAVELLNRSGLIVQTEHKVIVEDDRRDRAEVEAAVIAIAKRMNVDPKTLLGYSPANVIDGQFTEVSKDPNDLSDILA